MEIHFDNKIDNPSLQVGDIAYSVTPASGFATSPNKIGEITDIKDYYIEITTSTHTPLVDDLIMFSKNTVVNNSSLLGYYAEVKLSNKSIEKAELFAIGSEITQSSK
tara:strand:+ start:371 stop:691 length:321 start_codon:yes stop_codon:yes gene_type:complete